VREPDPSAHQRAWSAASFAGLGTIVAAQLALLWCLRVTIYPELIVYPYLTASGLLPYREILDQHFPGLLFLPVNFHTLGVRDAAGFHVLLMVVAAAQSVLTYVVARRLAGATVALVAAAAYALWQPVLEGDQLWLDTFLPLFTLPALLLLLDARWLLAGLLLGAGVVFKQTLVPLVAFAGLVILHERGLPGWRDVLRFAAGALLPSALMLIHFLRIGVLGDFWFWTVTFNLSAYASDGTLAPRLGDVVRIALPAALLLAASVLTPARWRSRLLALWACATVAGGLGRFGLIHLQPAVPYLAILIAMLLAELSHRRARVALVATLALTALWLGEFYLRRARWLDDPAATARRAALETLIRERTRPSDAILLLGVTSELYAATGTLPPGRVFVFPFPWFLDVAGERVREGYRGSATRLVLLDVDSGIDGRLLRDYARPLIDDVRARDVLTVKTGSIELYEPAR
jgi:hypothetical protein